MDWDTINSGPGDPRTGDWGPEDRRTGGPEDLRTREPRDPQLLRETEMQLQAKTHGYIIAWSMQSAWHKSEDIFSIHTVLSSSLSSSLFHFKILSDIHVPRSPAPPAKSDSRTLHKATKKHLTLSCIYSTAL